ncbi:MAG: hypothetical protein U0Q11_13900 [Vicinamibacterales bacterium]
MATKKSPTTRRTAPVDPEWNALLTEAKRQLRAMLVKDKVQFKDDTIDVASLINWWEFGARFAPGVQRKRAKLEVIIDSQGIGNSPVEDFGLTREDGLVMDVLHNYGNASIEAGFLLGVLVNSRASARELAALRRQLSLE